MSTFHLGTTGEDLICNFLESNGYSILDRNVRERFAEIDIVAEDERCLCFVEVRTRKGTDLGHPLETIGAKKQNSIRRAAEAYLARRNIQNREVRFDVATIVWSTGEKTLIKNAF